MGALNFSAFCSSFLTPLLPRVLCCLLFRVHFIDPPAHVVPKHFLKNPTSAPLSLYLTLPSPPFPCLPIPYPRTRPRHADVQTLPDLLKALPLWPHLTPLCALLTLGEDHPGRVIEGPSNPSATATQKLRRVRSLARMFSFT